MITAGSIARDNACKVGDTLYWQESRPRQQGRTTIVARDSAGTTGDLLPEPLSAQSKVHEYGGRCWLVDSDWLYYVEKSDQRLYRLSLEGTAKAAGPEPLTPAGEALRFADFCVDRRHRRLIAVTEKAGGAGAEPENYIAGIPLDGSGGEDGDRLQVLVSGSDFFAYPRISPDNEQLCWISWNHPRMPWDGTELYRCGKGGRW